jgi:hypothetical protein
VASGEIDEGIGDLSMGVESRQWMRLPLAE